MDFTVNRAELLLRLESVQPGLSVKGVIQQSDCFIFQNGQVITYNDEVACHNDSTLPAEFTGAVTAKPLVDQLRKWQEDVIVITPDNGELVITGKKRKTGIKMQHEVLLPIERIVPPTEWFLLHEDFSNGISIVQECAGKDESKYAAVCIHIHPDGFVEATDNYQICRYNVPTGVASQILIRKESLKHIIPFGMTEFSDSETWMHFRNPAGLTLSCRRSVGDDYPDLTEHLSIVGEPATLPKGLAEACEKALTFTSENKDLNHVYVDLRPGQMKVRGEGDSGWYAELKRLKYNGQPISFYIAPKLLADFTRKHNDCQITQDKIKFETDKMVYITTLGVPE